MAASAGLVKRAYWKAAKKFFHSYRELQRQSSISISGRNYRVPTIENSPLNFSNNHEEWLDPIFSAIQRYKGGAFLDVGANRGQTLAKFLSISPERNYIGFEPQVSCVSFLQEFFQLNELSNCVVVPVGLSDGNAIQRLYLHSGRAGDGTASIAEAHRPSSFYTQHRFIPVFKGDDVITEFDISEISALKIDAEGAELEVLRGFHDTISNRRPFIVFEVLHNFLVATGEDLSPELAEYRNRRASEISQTLKDLRYYIYNIRGRHLLRMDVIKPEVSSDLSTTDYLAIPKESDSHARMRFSEYFEFHDKSQIQTSA